MLLSSVECGCWCSGWCCVLIQLGPLWIKCRRSSMNCAGRFVFVWVIVWVFVFVFVGDDCLGDGACVGVLCRCWCWLCGCLCGWVCIYVRVCECITHHYNCLLSHLCSAMCRLHLNVAFAQWNNQRQQKPISLVQLIVD